MPSSTSSSESERKGPTGLPWGLLGAVLLFAVFEIVVRTVHPGGRVPYADGLLAYRSLPYELDRIGAAEVAIVGSSRAREAISMPTLRQRLDAAGVWVASVGNYGLPGAGPREVVSVIDLLLGSQPRPRLVIYGVTARQLIRGRSSDVGPAVHAWRIRQWWDRRMTDGAEVDPHLGVALRNTLGAHLHAFRHQPTVSDALRDEAFTWDRVERAMTTSWGHDSCPYGGGPTVRHKNTPYQRQEISRERVRDYLKRSTSGAPYVLDARELEVMGRGLQLLRAAGVDAVLVEVPLSSKLRAELPRGVVGRARRMLRGLAEARRVPFWTSEQLGVALQPGDFREQSHVNLHGAAKLTSAIARAVVVPWLKGWPRATAGDGR